jgi:hypothetical protein
MRLAICFAGDSRMAKDFKVPNTASLQLMLDALTQRFRVTGNPHGMYCTKAGYCDCCDCRQLRVYLAGEIYERQEALTCPHNDWHEICEKHQLPYHPYDNDQGCADCRAERAALQKKRETVSTQAELPVKYWRTKYCFLHRAFHCKCNKESYES